MAVILVVERDPNDAQRISDALRSEGWSVEIADGAGAALRSASADAPRLVLVAAGLADTGEILAAFARRRGGPGVLVLLGPGEVAPLDADASLQKPLFVDELRETVRAQLRAGSQPSLETRPERAGGGRPLTSADIFADVLAEVEAEVGWPPVLKPEQPPAPAPVSPTLRTVRKPGADIDRRLEETLSGVLDFGGLRRRPSAPAASAANPPAVVPPAPAAQLKPPTQVPAALSTAPVSNIDDLLDKTLSSLDLPARPRKPASTTAPPAVAEPPAAPPTPPAFELSPFEIPELEPFGSSPFPDLPETPAIEPEAPSDFRTQRLPALDALEALREPRAEPASTEISGETLGEYTLLERIAVGGMAEVWKARRRGVEGFQKTVAIKRILAHLTATPDFVKMFIDEANLAAQLNHDNIIQIYHLGKESGDLFIAMEYIEGMDLRTMLTTARQKGRPLPVGLALLIVARVARALDYAHRKRDFDHRALGLVHRDVSPQNVLISYEGEVKLCDFGIVKAVSKASTTQMGALKGKLQYMSPEQAWGKAVDARSDIFSLGSVLYEMLTGRKLFAADTEVGVLDAVRECVVPPLGELDPSLPPGKIERILHKALAKRPDNRYQTAGELEQELEAVLFSLKPTPSLSELAAYMKRLVQEPAVVVPAVAPGPAPITKTDVEPLSAVVTPDPPVATGTAAPAGGDQSKARLMALLALLVILAAVVIYFWSRAGRPGGDEQPEIGTPPAEAAPAVPGSPPDAEGTAGTVPENLEEMVKERLDEREENIRRSLEAQKRRLEEELRRTQEENQELEKAAQPPDSGATEPADPPPP